MFRPLTPPGGYGNSIQSRSPRSGTVLATLPAGKTGRKAFFQNSPSPDAHVQRKLRPDCQEAAATPAPPLLFAMPSLSQAANASVSTGFRGPCPIPPATLPGRREALKQAVGSGPTPPQDRTRATLRRSQPVLRLSWLIHAKPVTPCSAVVCAPL